MNAVSFGELLRRHRTEAGYSQEDLAARARLSVESVGSLERGTRRAPYRETVALLAEALALSAVERIAFESAAARGRPRVTSERRSAPAPARKLPIQSTSFFGRTDDIKEIRDLLNSNRLVTITGSGGIGKTRTAIEVVSHLAEDRPITFVDLAHLVDGTFIGGAIATAILGTAQGGSSIDALVASLVNHRMLIVLDNCEHLIGHVALIVASILKSCEHVSFLATSRERLALAGETVYRLPSLADSAASDLFIERAAAADARDPLKDDHTGTIAEICRRLDGIPLAIELAAARAPAYGLKRLLERLSNGLGHFSAGRNLPARQQTMFATIAWSYDLLGAAEQILFTRLSVFAGGFTLDAAEAVCSGNDFPATAVVDFVSTLIDKSLLNVSGTGAYRRYNMYDSVRGFAAERLAQDDRVDDVKRRHAEWIAGFADWVETERITMPSRWLREEVDPELENARLALEWLTRSNDEADAVMAGRIIGGLRTIWLVSGRHEECRRWAESALQNIDDVQEPEIFARVMRALIQIAEGSELTALYERALPVFERIGDSTAVALTLSRIATRLLRIGQLASAGQHIDRAASLMDSELRRSDMTYVTHLDARTLVRISQGRFDEALSDIAEAKALLKKFGDDEAWEWLMHRGFVELAQGNYDEVVRSYAPLLDRAYASSVPHFRAIHLGTLLLSYTLVLLGDIAAARAVIRRFLIVFGGPIQGSNEVIGVMAIAAAREGNARAAFLLVGFAEKYVGRITAPSLPLAIEDALSSMPHQYSLAEVRRLRGEGLRMSFDSIAALALEI